MDLINKLLRRWLTLGCLPDLDGYICDSLLFLYPTMIGAENRTFKFDANLGYFKSLFVWIWYKLGIGRSPTYQERLKVRALRVLAVILLCLVINLGSAILFIVDDPQLYQFLGVPFNRFGTLTRVVIAGLFFWR
jgi:hypothetical protein